MIAAAKKEVTISPKEVFATCLVDSAIYDAHALSIYAMEGYRNYEMILNDLSDTQPSITCNVSFHTPLRTETVAEALEVEITATWLNEDTEVTLTATEQATLEAAIAELIAKHI